MGRDNDVDVVVGRVLDYVALRKGCGGCPVAAISAKLLRNGQLAAAVKGKDLVGARCSRHCEFGGCDGVGARCLD